MENDGKRKGLAALFLPPLLKSASYAKFIPQPKPKYGVILNA
jgi:hypothetical protein